MNSILQAGPIAGGKDPRDGRETSSHLTPLAMKPKKNTMIEQSQEKYTTRTSGTFLRMQSVGSIWEKHKRMTILANPISRHHPS